MCISDYWDFGQHSSPVCVKPGCSTTLQLHQKNYDLKFHENKAIAEIFCHPGHQMKINGTAKVNLFLNVHM